MLSPVTIAETLHKLYGDARDQRERDLAVKTIAKVLRNKGALHLVPRISLELERFARRAAGITDVEIVTAHKLETCDAEKAAEKAAELLKKTRRVLKLEYRSDSALLGGMIIKTNELLIDRSINSRLNRLKERLRG